MNNTIREHTLTCPAKSNNNLLQCRCDSFHTFEELYEHRIGLFIQFCKKLYQLDVARMLPPEERNRIWCSALHSDGTKYDNWFIMGINKDAGNQITYHLPARYWNEVCKWAEVLDKAPEFDGHTSNDVLERLKKL